MMNYREAAEYLGKKTQTLRQMKMEGTLTPDGYDPHGRPLFTKDTLDAVFDRPIGRPADRLPPGCLNVAAAALAIGKSEKTLRNWITSGRVEPHRNPTYFTPEMIEALKRQ